MIFLDNASTTPLCESGAQNLLKYSTELFYNPSASYSVGFENFKKIQNTKLKLAQKLGVEFKNNIIFTGSATEATNLAIFGSYRKNWKKAVFSAGEHPSVYNCALELQARGVEVVFVDLDKNGAVDLEKLTSVLDENVAFISIMHVSNETGAINNLEKIARIKQQKSPKAIFHVDGVQAFGKIPVNLSQFQPDFYTISAHKFHGPKGLGALYALNPQKLKPVTLGGGQEYNLRSGTENLPAIMALDGALSELESNDLIKVKKINQSFKTKLKESLLPEISIKIMEGDNFSPYVISLSFKGIKGEVLQNLCDQNGLLVSTGSACSSKKSGNRILENIGHSAEEIVGSIRVSCSRYTTLEDAINGALILSDCANKLWRNTR